MVSAAFPRPQDERGFRGRRKGKGKGGKGSSGKRFFKRKKGKSNLADDNSDAWQTTDGQWQDSQWQDQYWDDWSWYESEESYAAKGKGKKGKKGKGKGKFSKDGKDGKSGKDGHSQLAEAVPSGTTAATTFFSEYINPLNFSLMATENKTEEAFISQPLTPTAMVLDLGCTRAMASRVAAQDLMKFCEAPETLGAFRQWTEENNCVPKENVGDQAFFTSQFVSYYKFHGITPYPCGPRTPWPNRADTAVRLFKRTWSIMAKALADEGREGYRSSGSEEGGVGKELPTDRLGLFSFRDSYRTTTARSA